MPTHSGESFSQMLRRVENRSAGRAAEGAMAMPGKPFGKKDAASDKVLAPTASSSVPTFGSKGSAGSKGRFGKKAKFGKKGFAPASRALRGGAR